MKPRGLTCTCVFSRPGISEFGFRPTETSTRSKSFLLSLSGTFAPSKVARIPEPSSLSEATVVFSKIDSNNFSSRLCNGTTRSRSAPGSRPDSISTTVTRVPSAAYTEPSSSPIYPPPTTRRLPGISSRFRAPVESIMRGESNLRAGMMAGREPVATMTRSKLIETSLESVFVIRNVEEFSKAARP